jgi:hypothetical protein
VQGFDEHDGAGQQRDHQAAQGIRLAIEPLSALRMLIRSGLGLTIMVVYLRKCSP